MSALRRRATREARPPASCFACQPRDHSAWSVLPSVELALLNDAKTATVYAAGQAIFHQGGRCLGIYCLESGTAAVKRRGSRGGEAITSLHRPGETLGHRAYFAGNGHTGTAYAVTKCRVCFLDRKALRRLLERNPALARRFLGHLARDLDGADEALLACRALPVRARIAHTLLMLKDRFDPVDEEGRLVLTLPLSRAELACLVGVRRESLSRGIRQLEEAGVARFQGKRVLVPDLDALLDEIDGHSPGRRARAGPPGPT